MNRLYHFSSQQNFTSASKAFGLATKLGRDIASKRGVAKTVETIEEYNGRRASNLMNNLSERVKKMVRKGEVKSLEDRSLDKLERRAERIMAAKEAANRSAYKTLGLAGAY